LEDRVLNCFMRSQNGLRPPNGSQVSVAITTYITWLSEGSPIKMNVDGPLGPNHTPDLNLDGLMPDAKRGAALYASRCAECHGENGLGGDDGPPVWGEQSYNAGAGMSRVPKLASWLKVAMPLDDATLTAQQAFDIASFVNGQQRPKFALPEHKQATPQVAQIETHILCRQRTFARSGLASSQVDTVAAKRHAAVTGELGWLT
jgi:thiosulfate dehydrogenase